MVKLENTNFFITDELYSALLEHKSEMVEANPEMRESLENASLDFYLSDLLFKFGHRLYKI